MREMSFKEIQATHTTSRKEYIYSFTCYLWSWLDIDMKSLNEGFSVGFNGGLLCLGGGSAVRR